MTDGRGDARETDTGVYNERTALAWQRTALSLLAGSAVVARLSFAELRGLAVAGFLLVLALALWVMVESRGRYAHHAGVRLRPRSRGGRAPAALVLVVVLIGATEMGALVAESGRGVSPGGG